MGWDPEERKRRKRSLILTFLLFLLFIGLTAIQVSLQQVRGKNVLVPSNVLVLVIINLNLIVLMVLIVMVGRNLVKIYFEHKRGILGSKFKAKLITAFIALSIIPTVLLFLVASGLITSSIESWFTQQREEALKDSLTIAQAYYEELNRRGKILTENILSIAKKQELLDRENYWKLVWLLKEKAKEHDVKVVEIFDRHGEILGSSKGRKEAVEKAYLVSPKDEKLMRSFSKREAIAWDHKRYHLMLFPFNQGVVALTYKLPSSLHKSLIAIGQYHEGYRQLKELKKPLKISYIIAFLMATLLIIFSSIWFGLHLAKGITIPIEALASGTREVASGNLDTQIDVKADDEIGILVDSFNLMTKDLKRSRGELEERRRYIETILDNIATGVISIDKEGKISSINRAARSFLKLGKVELGGISYKQLFKDERLEALRNTVREMLRSGKDRERRELKLITEEGVMILVVGLSTLVDSEGRYSGMVIVMEDLTELAKAQRAAAWEEVARRVAHEIKNPLTPISLSAQRLKRRFGHLMEAKEGEVFYRCIETIIREVEELKRMVNEFYRFARLPEVSPRPTKLGDIIEDLVALYKASHKDIKFDVKISPDVPTLLLDKDQIKRAFMNLMENAIEAMKGMGKIAISAGWNESSKSVVVEVADEGVGIPPEDRERLFMPYFSTKEHGTGLGLAIVSRIVADHGGYIRVRENKPKGAVFVIELPGRAA